MKKIVIRQRKRIYIAVEGEGEQAFIKFLQHLSDQNGLHIHLDCVPLSGGGYKSMLKKAIHNRSRRERNTAKDSILLVDGDRADKSDDGWTLEKLLSEATKKKFTVCLQNPNQEGLLLRMIPGNERLQPHATTAHKLLQKEWDDYQKPTDAHTLKSKFSLEDLLRAARVDEELKRLLRIIGLLIAV